MQPEDLGAIPLFPLPNVVLLPAGVIPLHVFESRYCALVEEVLGSNQLLGLPQLAPGWESNYHGDPDIYPTFGLGRILQHEVLEGGRFNILVEGIARVRVLEEGIHPKGFREAKVSLVSDTPGDSAALSRATRKTKLALGQLISLSPQLRDLSALMELDLDAANLSDTLAHAIMTDPSDRQAYIETNAVSERMGLTQKALESVLAEFMSR